MQDILEGVRSDTQRILVSAQQRIVVTEETIEVFNPTTNVEVISAGPQGPPGVKGDQGEAGLDSGTVVEAMMIAHVNSPSPHPAYDDIPSLVLLFENGLY